MFPLWIIHRLRVRDPERFLVTQRGRFVGIFGPGLYHFFGFGYSFEKHNAGAPTCNSKWVPDLLSRHPNLVLAHFHLVETQAAELALIYRNGRLERVQAPEQRTLVWRNGDRIVLEWIDAESYPIAPLARTAELLRLGDTENCLFGHVPEAHAGLFFRGGRLASLLSPGAYAFWRATQTPSLKTMDLRVQTLDYTAEDLLTRDRQPVRVELRAEYRIVDPAKAHQAAAVPAEHLPRLLAPALRESLASRTLDDVLAAPRELEYAVSAHLRPAVAALGCRVSAISIQDLFATAAPRRPGVFA